MHFFFAIVGTADERSVAEELRTMLASHVTSFYPYPNLATDPDPGAPCCLPWRYRIGLLLQGQGQMLQGGAANSVCCEAMHDARCLLAAACVLVASRDLLALRQDALLGGNAMSGPSQSHSRSCAAV